MTELYDAHSRHFQFRDGKLYAENVDLATLVAEHGTPLYVYSREAILDAYMGYEKGLEGIPHQICYAVKANGNVQLIKLLAEKGAGADLTSAGELTVALKGGIPAEKIVFSGVGKTLAEIRYALECGIMMFNVESEPELEAINRVAADMGKQAPVAVRVNPDVDAKTHPKISTGLKEHKFGVPWESCVALYEKAAAMNNIKVKGIAAHIGSSLADTTPLLDALDRIMGLRDTLKSKGIEIPVIDIGGGLGIRYESESPKSTQEYAEQLRQKIKDSGATVLLEPGRSIMGNAAVLVCEVQYVKRTDDRAFVIVDAAMNDLARPAIYGAYHHITPVVQKDGAFEPVDIVGPICESSDVFGKQRQMPRLDTGDLLAICSAGAYGFAMASHYNGRVKPAEVLVEGDSHRIIRKREPIEELFRYQVV